MWNVLIAEDDKNISQQLKDSLYKVAVCTVASTGIEAIALYREALDKGKFLAPPDGCLDIVLLGLAGAVVLCLGVILIKDL